MFSGLIEEIGTVTAFERRGSDARVRIRASEVLSDLKEGDSIACSGPCLTAINIGDGQFACDISAETLQRTTLGALKVGDRLNLERSVRLQDRLGGHLVQGHIDGAGRVHSRERVGESELWWFEIPEAHMRYIVEKGSIALDGISLTVAGLEANRLSVALIPTTLKETTLGDKGPGDPVNVECDIIAKYVEKLLGSGPKPEEPGSPGGLTMDKIHEWGFLRDTR